MRSAWLWVAITAAIRASVAALTLVPARDADHYLWMASRTAEGDVGALFATVFHPLYPALVAVPLWLFPELDPFVAGQLVACLGASLAVIPLWRLSMRLSAGDRRAAHIACLAYAVGVWFARHPADALSEGVFLPLAVWSVERLLACRGRVGPAIVAGVCAGLAYGARPEGAALWICGAPWLWMKNERRSAIAMSIACALAALPWPIGWAVWGPGLTITPKAAFNLAVGAGGAENGAIHYLENLIRLAGVAFEAIGYLALPAAILGALHCRPRRLTDDSALPLAVFALQFLVAPLLRSNVRFLAGYGILLMPFAGIGMRAIGARLGVRRPAWAAAALALVFAGDLVRLPRIRRADRVVVCDLGIWLGTRLGAGETIASDMPRLVWAAGMPPMLPRRITREEILAQAASARTRYVAVIPRRSLVTAGDLAALGFRPVALPADLARAVDARGMLVLER